MNNNVESEIRRLNYEDILWGLFILTSILNIIGNEHHKKYLIRNDTNHEIGADNIYIIALIVVIFIYIYFFKRNYRMYSSKGEDARIEDLVKVFGSGFLILGIICLLYFQIKSENNFINGIR